MGASTGSQSGRKRSGQMHSSLPREHLTQLLTLVLESRLESGLPDLLKDDTSTVSPREHLSKLLTLLLVVRKHSWGWLPRVVINTRIFSLILIFIVFSGPSNNKKNSFFQKNKKPLSTSKFKLHIVDLKRKQT